MRRTLTGTAALKRREARLILVVAAVGAALAAGLVWCDTAPSVETSTRIVVFRPPACKCCEKWATHLRRAGLNVELRPDGGSIAQRAILAVPAPLRTCHTAVAGDYLIVGHVPAADIERLLLEKPRAQGIAVPGMPIGSPGMERGVRQDPYDVLLFQSDGEVSTYSRHGGGSP